jgi:hypothetical protein
MRWLGLVLCLLWLGWRLQTLWQWLRQQPFVTGCDRGEALSSEFHQELRRRGLISALP